MHNTTVWNWQSPPVIGIKPKSRAKVRTIAEQRAYILSDKALTFNTTIQSVADGIRNARIDGRNVTLGR